MVFRIVAARDAGSSLLGLLLRLDLLPHALGHAGAARLFVAEDMRMAADHLRGDGLDDVAEGEFAGLLSHLRMVDDLQQEVAELVAQIVEIAARNRVRHLVGLLDRVGRDGRKILLDVPWAAGRRRPQRRHDLDQPGNVLRGFHQPDAIVHAAGRPMPSAGEGALSTDAGAEPTDP